MFHNDAKGLARRNEADAAAPNEGIGATIHRTKNLVCLVYDFAVLGGVQGAIKLVDDHGDAFLFPKGATITNVIAVCLTTVTSAGAATVSLDLLATADLMAATAKASLVQTAGSQWTAGKPVGTAATLVGPVTSATGTQPTATVATADLTAGKIKFFVEYWIQ